MREKILRGLRLYELTSVPGFEGVEFTHGSGWIGLDELIAHNKRCAEHGIVLQSAREAAAFTIDDLRTRNPTGSKVILPQDQELCIMDASGRTPLVKNDDLDRAYQNQATRTGIVYFKRGQQFYAAVDDFPVARDNIVLAKAVEAYEAKKHNFFLPMADEHVKSVLERAESTNRVLQVQMKKNCGLCTEAHQGKSEFGENDWNRAILGDVAELYAATLNNLGRVLAEFSTLKPDHLESIGVDERNVLVSYCGIGHTGILMGVFADTPLNYLGGHARWVRNAKKWGA